MSLILATGNKDKVREMKRILGEKVEVKTRLELGIDFEPEENGDTLEKNALIKAESLLSELNKRGLIKEDIYVLSEDSGIFVRALNWAPGIHSRRFAGEGASDEENNSLLIKSLREKKDTCAEYRSVICLIDALGSVKYFKGRCRGNITFEKRGSNGFGYDPYFIPEGFDKTFGELSDEIKNKISHRALAMKDLKFFFKV